MGKVKIFIQIIIFIFITYSLSFTRTITLIDSFKREITLEVPVKRACLLVTYELIPVLKIRSQVVAIGNWAYKDPIMKATVLDLNQIPSPGVGGPRLNVELLKKLQTDLIITFRVPLEELIFLESKGIKTWAIYPNSIEELIEIIKWHGIIFGKEKEAERILKEMRKILKLIESRISNLPFKKKKRVLWLHSDLTSVAGGTGIVNDTLIQIGAINPAASIFPNSTIAKTSLETIIRLDPEIIFIWGAAPFSPSDLINNPSWEKIKAVKEKKVYKLQALSTFSPRHVIDMLYMAIKVYPEYFEDLDFDKIANDFYQRVFGITSSEIIRTLY